MREDTPGQVTFPAWFVLRLMVLTVGTVLVVSAVPAAAAIPPCSRLLTLQDVTKAAGPGFTPPPKETAAVLGPPGCVYQRERDRAGNYVGENIMLGIKEHPGGAALKLGEASSGFRISGATVEAASGLGPGAFYVPDVPDAGILVFFGKGNLYFQLTYKVGKQPDPKAALALAKVIYGRL